MWHGHYLFVGSGAITELSLSVNSSFPVLLVNSVLYRAPQRRNADSSKSLWFLSVIWFLLGQTASCWAQLVMAFSSVRTWFDKPSVWTFPRRESVVLFAGFQLLLLCFHCTLLLLLLQYSPCSAENYGHVFLSVIPSRFLLVSCLCTFHSNSTVLLYSTSLNY